MIAALRRGIKGGLVVLLSVLVGLALFEIALRWFAPQFQVNNSGIFEYDEARGYRHRSNMDRGAGWAGNIRYHIKTNSLGQRDDEPDPQSEIRILAIGDSHTFGVAVEEAETYPRRLETVLKEQTGRRIDVVNAGVPAYGWLEEIAVVREYIANHRVDLMLWQTSFNDINDNGMGIPKYLLDGDGRLIYQYSRKRPGGFGDWGLKTRDISWLEVALLKRSHVATLLIGNYHRVMYQINREAVEAEINRYKWRVSAEAFQQMIALAGGVGTPILFVLHPGERIGQFGRWSDVTEGLKQMIKDSGIPYIDLTPLIEKVENPETLFVPNDEHFNSEGYRWMVDQIAPVVEQQLALSPAEDLQTTSSLKAP